MKSGEKCEKVGKSGKKWGKVGKVGKSGKKLEKWGKVANSVICWNFLQNGLWRPFWMTENHLRSHFSPFQINTQLFIFFSKWPPAAILDPDFCQNR